MKSLPNNWRSSATKKRGASSSTSSDHEALFARGKNPVDGAIPSGNSVAASNLLLLAKNLKKPDLIPHRPENHRRPPPVFLSSPQPPPRGWRLRFRCCWSRCRRREKAREERDGDEVGFLQVLGEQEQVAGGDGVAGGNCAVDGVLAAGKEGFVVAGGEEEAPRFFVAEELQLFGSDFIRGCEPLFVAGCAG